MLPIVKSKPHPRILRYIIDNFMADATGEDVSDLVGRYIRDELELWVCENRGFLLLYVREYPDQYGKQERELVVLCVQGMGMYNRDGIASLNELAKREGCSRLVCYVKRKAIVRLLERIGFRLAYSTMQGSKSDVDFVMEREVENGE